MAAQKLCLQSMGDLNGGMARGVIDSAFNAAVLDLDDRGDDGKSRKVTITLEMKRDKEIPGVVGIFVEAVAKIPPYKVGGTVGELSLVGGECQVQFRSNSPDNPKQRNMIDDLNEAAADDAAAD